MKELLEYREKLIARYAEATKEFCKACESFFANPFEKIEGDWNLHQVAAHLRDIEKLVYAERIRETLQGGNPHFKSFDPDVWMAQQYDKDEPLNKILLDFDSDVTELCHLLKNLGREDWSRLSSHESAGNEMTLQVWVERGLAHIEEHLQNLKKQGKPKELLT
ncbi:MAG: DinB superfamily protein [Chloroflexi bacterium OLB14]|nr:MAG: DinB superfamily protein [Chloroflexi bacterium OLB14]